MYCISEFCYVCMSKESRVKCVKSTDTAYVEIIHKLHSCMFIAKWSKINENYLLICENCTVNLQIAYDFIRMCNKNSNRMQAYVSTLENGINSNENKTCELNVSLVDITSPNSDTEEESTTLETKDSDNDFLGFSNEEIRTSSLYSREICDKLIEHTETFQKLVKDSFLYNDKPFQCSICKKSYSRAFTLKRHTAIHNGVKYKCTICEKQFNCKFYLDRHILTHAGTPRKYFECTLCCKRFTTKSSLKAHYLIHKGKKSHRCLLCNRRFTYKSSLTRHMLVHNGFKSHMCQYCKKQFGLKSNLNVHLMIHNDIKPFACTMCDKRFTQKMSLTEHLAMHSSQKPYSCLVCLKDFKTNAALKRHQLVHSNNIFQCELCSLTFRVKDYLRRHFSRVHR